MTNNDIDCLKDIADDLEFGALDYMKADGYTHKNDGNIWVACAISDLKEFISQQEKAKQTLRPVIVFRGVPTPRLVRYGALEKLEARNNRPTRGCECKVAVDPASL